MNNLLSFFKGTIVGLIIVFFYLIYTFPSLIKAQEITLPIVTPIVFPEKPLFPTQPPFPTRPSEICPHCYPSPSVSPSPSLFPTPSASSSPTPTSTPAEENNGSGTGGAPFQFGGPPPPPDVEPSVLGLSYTSSGGDSVVFWFGSILLFSGLLTILKSYNEI